MITPLLIGAAALLILGKRKQTIDGIGRIGTIPGQSKAVWYVYKSDCDLYHILTDYGSAKGAYNRKSMVYEADVCSDLQHFKSNRNCYLFNEWYSIGGNKFHILSVYDAHDFWNNLVASVQAKGYTTLTSADDHSCTLQKNNNDYVTLSFFDECISGILA